MVSQAEIILRVITLWFLVLSHFLKTVWVPLNIFSVVTYMTAQDILMLRSLPLVYMVNTSLQFENSVRYHFLVIFTSGERGSFDASPFVPLGVLDLVDAMLAVYFHKISFMFINTKILWQILQNTRQETQIKTLQPPKTPPGILMQLIDTLFTL